MTPTSSEAPLQFGRFVLDAARRLVLHGDRPLELPRRVFEALALLAEARGGIVDRDTLVNALWRGVAVEETSLTKVISQLRRALAEDSGIEYIETVNGWGYRLAVPVKPLHEEAKSTADSVAGPVAEGTRAEAKGRRQWMWAGTAGVLLAAAVFGGRWGMERQQELALAERYFQDGQVLRGRGTSEGISASIAVFSRAAQLDPNNARYHLALAEAMSRSAPQEKASWGLALGAAKRSVVLDPGCAGCRAVLGFLLFSRFWAWDEAEAQLRTALRLASGDGGTRGYLAMLLLARGRLEEALTVIDEAVKFSPYTANLHTIRAQVLGFLGRHEEALAATERGFTIDASNKGLWDTRGYSLWMLDRQRDAIEAWQKIYWEERARDLDAALRAKGAPGALGVLLEFSAEGRARKLNSVRRARWKALMGDQSGALEELEAALEYRHFNLMYIASDPAFATLRTEPRFQHIVKAMGLGPAD